PRPITDFRPGTAGTCAGWRPDGRMTAWRALPQEQRAHDPTLSAGVGAAPGLHAEAPPPPSANPPPPPPPSQPRIILGGQRSLKPPTGPRHAAATGGSAPDPISKNKKVQIDFSVFCIFLSKAIQKF